jgi:WD40 repeat protein
VPCDHTIWRCVISLAFSTGTGLLAVGDVSGSVSLWNVTDLQRPVPLTDLAGKLNGAWSTKFGPRGDTLITADQGSARIWDLGSVLASHSEAVTAVQLNHRGDLLATSGDDHTLRLWRADGEQPRALATLDVGYTPRSLSISPDDRTLLLDGLGPTQVWDIAAPTRPVRAATLPETYTGASIAFDPTDTTAVISQRDRATNVYDLADPYHPKLVDDLAPVSVNGVAFHPGGNMLAVSKYGYVELWDPNAHVTSRKLAMIRTHAGSVSTFGPDGRTLSVFLYDKREIQLWGISDPRRPDLLTTFHPHGPVNGGTGGTGPPPVYSADGHVLAVPDGERTVQVWDISDPRKPASVATFTFGRQVEALSMAPDGRRLFAATAENVVQSRYLDVEDVTKRICAVAYPRISPTEWRTHFRDLPYQPPYR